MPLSFAKPGDSVVIQKVGGSNEIKSHLEHLGFIVGTAISVISVLNGNVIVNIKNSRIAISKEMANKIII